MNQLSRMPSDYHSYEVEKKGFSSSSADISMAIDPAPTLRYHGEEMANRPDFTPDATLTEEQLVELRQQYARLSTPSLQQAYTEALERCKLDRMGRAPASIHVQVLVQMWRQLRKTGVG
jgi:hypothetical protein